MIGDTIALPGVEGPVSLRVVGTVVDSSCGRGTVMLDRAPYGRLFDAEGGDLFGVAVSASADAESIGRRTQQGPRAAELARRALPRPALRRHIPGMVRRLYGVAYVQELVAAAVAALGVATALMVAVFQRRRELGLLRAAGATPAQVFGAVVAEAALMAIIGVLFGLLIGVPLEWYVLRVVLLEETGFVFPMWLPWGDAAMIAALMVLGCVIAGLVPAVGAARTRITEAIAYE
ncbi:MAG: ABC transporter permease [Planctomycetaceae bacterium]|nr:ABC transporter permease [Planctomycetaceae bacterium]